MTSLTTSITAHLERSAETKAATANRWCGSAAAAVTAASIKAGGKLMLCGNGGSLVMHNISQLNSSPRLTTVSRAPALPRWH